MSSRYQIVADESMPGVDKLFGDIANITYINGRKISNSALIESRADALLCRSITKVNQSLLKNTSVKFVGTATIGTDHLDSNWLNKNAIQWSNAAGCNAAAVAQYVLSAVSYWCLEKSKSLTELTVGIVGAGNVGTELSRCLSYLGVKFLLCDPPLNDAGDPRQFVNLSAIMQCDVVTLHVPLTLEGPHKTQYLMGAKELAQLNNNQLLINASRGAVINNHELEQYLPSANSAQVILDVFENEPNISANLLSMCLLSTPHIAGHTLEGKLRGSWMVYQAFCRSFSVDIQYQESFLYPEKNQLNKPAHDLENLLIQLYDIRLDSNSLKIIPNEHLAGQFDQLRKNATQLASGITRRDYSGWLLPQAVAGLA